MVPDDVSFQFLREITDDFSEQRIIGQGAFGVVYKGVTKDGHDVAVKKLNTRLDDPNNKQFHNEFDTLRKLKHENIVKFLGYCYEIKKEPYTMPDGRPFKMPDGSEVLVEKMHTALCFEYLHNGSLQKHLSDESREVKLDWHMRFKIIKGICEGLKYMHKYPEEPIYHFDLKPDNILLNKDMVPKIADFGLSRMFGKDTIRTTLRAYGTIGYQPPEYIDRNEISVKFDIFSLGAVMKEIVSSPMGYPKCSDNMSSNEFIDQVRENWRKKLQEACSSSDSLLEACRQVEICTQIALNCLDEDSQKRPNIVEIIEMLNGIEVSVGKLPDKGCGTSFPEMTPESKDITFQRQNTDLLSRPSCTKLEPIDRPKILTDVVDELIVGREEEKRKIIASLLESSSKKIVLPIHGIGGIGKTTFSRLIYNDPKFKNYRKAWVHVSQRYDSRKIRESIISQLSKQVNVVHSSLTELLPGNKIMIVLDDLWEDNQFQLTDLKNMVYHDDSKIIILVTTRSESVADRICTNVQPYKILPLTNDMCWDIIKQRSRFEAREDKEKLRGIGQEIAQKCVGVALAAQSLGFTLRSMNLDQWMKVKDNDIWKEQISNDISLPNHVLASLMLSYSYMDPSLQSCFTYCAIFPKGHQIFRNDLICQWISLGFLKPTQLLSVMDLGQKYIMQLQGLSFLKESPKTSQKATIFTMHDLVHDLAFSLLGNKLLDKSKQENSMVKSKDYQYGLLEDCSMLLSLTSATQLLALRFHDCRSTEQHSAAFAPATTLRVLDLSECYIKMLPDSISELKKLRYLNAPGMRDQQFPECITKLSHIIFLNLHGSDIENLPESIGEMKDLMHLDLSDSKITGRLPNSFRSLEKLVHLDFCNCYRLQFESDCFSSLIRLEHLSLSNCQTKGNLAKVLCGLTELQYLDLSDVSDHIVDPSRGLDRSGGLQQVLARFTKLRYLDASRLLLRYGDDNFIEAISKLSSLEYLNLSHNVFLYNVPDSFGNLSKLHILDVSYCNNLERLPAAIFGMNNMLVVYADGCDNLDESTVAVYRNVLMLSYLEVLAGDSEPSSNLYLLEYADPTKLEISRLENVKSAAEAQRVKLAEKQRIKELALEWTRDAKRFVVEDKDVLEQLVPPSTVKQFRVQGYNSTGFPSWMMGIAAYVPNLVDVTLEDMPNCSSLPPLGQLPNLKYLSLGRMDSIRKIDQGLDGEGRGAFPRLTRFKLQKMKNLEEWNTSCSCSYPSAGDEEVFRKRALPDLGHYWDTSDDLKPSCSYPGVMVDDCPMLRFKSLSPLALGKDMSIIHSCFIPSSWMCRAGFDADTSSVAITELRIEYCEEPLQEWSLLRHLPCLKSLVIKSCSDLTCSSTDLLRCLSSLVDLSIKYCNSIAALPERLGDLTCLENLEISHCEGIKALPERLGDLTSLKNLTISDCIGIKALPESIQQLTCLQRLEIDSCQQLLQLRCPTSIKVLSIKRCNSIAALPERLGDLTSLENLEIRLCEGIKALPESIQQLTCLQRLQIYGCQQLLQLRCPTSIKVLSVKNCDSIAEVSWLGDLICLENLEIIRCRLISAKALPLTCLRRLAIYDCPQLIRLCESKKLAHIETLIVCAL